MAATKNNRESGLDEVSDCVTAIVIALCESEFAADYFLVLVDLIDRGGVAPSVLDVVDNQVMKDFFDFLAILVLWDMSPVVLELPFSSS